VRARLHELRWLQFECEIALRQSVERRRRRVDPIEDVAVEAVVVQRRVLPSVQVTFAHEGSRAKASTSSSAQGHPAAMRTVRRRAEEIRIPALCKRV